MNTLEELDRLRGLGSTIVVVGWVAACTAASQTSPADCPMVGSTACPSGSPPSWAMTIQPIVEHRCGPCHLEGGVETKARFPIDYTTYAGVYAEQTTIPGVLKNCLMPPPDAGALPLGDKQALLEWLACGAPDN